MSPLGGKRQKITGEVALPQELSALLEKEVQGLQDLAEKLPSFEAADTSRLVMALLGAGALLDVSDLHLEAEEDGAKLRARIDGILQDVARLPQKTYEAVLSRIKLLSGIKLNVSDRPQDGRFTFVLKEQSVETRVSSLPSEHGESLVLRILNPQNLKTIQDLGLRKDLLALFEKEITKPNGMILVTGPTGSGKTTTLYAFLKGVERPEIKIVTIEDPIEYRLEGISQTQVKPGKDYTFASGLRAIVRQDPDVILVGEIRDRETAAIAVQAALTGHLVFSTL
ncbi:MAG: ATPase, T2SS/T4P/T4SS family, partial [bacterium]|nr:ATPase, T2SS/T4P/T4SS family [bacterium]